MNNDLIKEEVRVDGEVTFKRRNSPIFSYLKFSYQTTLTLVSRNLQ